MRKGPEARRVYLRVEAQQPAELMLQISDAQGFCIQGPPILFLLWGSQRDFIYESHIYHIKNENWAFLKCIYF